MGDRTASDIAKLPAEELLLREDFTLGEIWNALQVIQADFCFGQEVSAYYTSPAWLRARTVLDVGTGNGHYLARLAGHFPDKQYRGIDVEADHIDVARRTVAQPSLRFERGDLYAATGRYDALLARLLFQHLTRVPEALDAVANLLRPGGVAVIVDANDAARHLDPAPPEYLRFFRAYTANQGAHGMSREAALHLPELVRGHPRLECSRVTDVVIPSTVGENLELFKKTYYLVILMVELTGRLRHDFGRVKEEWRRWCAADRVYMQVGIRIVQLARRDAV
jgi:SAM-dependent methyltransferase